MLCDEYVGNATHVFEGILTSDKGKEYKIVSGIVHMLDQGDLYDEAREESRARDEEAVTYDRRLSGRFEKEVPSTLKPLGHVTGKILVDYGCGTGRLTQHINGADGILGVDMSLESLIVFQKKLASDTTIGLVYADASTFRTKENHFDGALSSQLYEHIPTQKQRVAFLRNIQKTVKDGGCIVMTMYHHDVRRMLMCAPQEGKHTSGVFYHYFTRSEIEDEFSLIFKDPKIAFIDITLPMETRLQLPARMGGVLSRLVERVPYLNRFGHLVRVSVVVKEKGVEFDKGVFFPFLFRRRWVWFGEPREATGYAMANFYSYCDGKYVGFHKKEGCTSVINLSLSEEELWNGLRKKYCRKQIEAGEREGIVIKESTDFALFKKMYTDFRKQKNIPADNTLYFKKAGTLRFAYYKNIPIAGAVYLSDGYTMRLWAAASTRLSGVPGRDRDVIGRANRMLMWHAIRSAKQNSVREFDLGGLSGELCSGGEGNGLDEFKESFGGKRKKCYFYYKVYSPSLRWWMRLRGFKNV